MTNFKSEIAQMIADSVNLEKSEIESYIEEPKNEENGDYSFPCFKLAKQLKKSPQAIAEEIKSNIKINNCIIDKIDIISGYINFYINNEKIIQEVLFEIDNKKEKYGSSEIGNNKSIVIDYSSPNIAKPFHIGHLRSTVIGGALYNIYNFLGYNAIGINHLGDWGTQFGKLIEGYKRWESEYNVEENPIDELTKIYIRINNLCKEDENVLEQCRNNFKKLEDGDEYCVNIWNRFRKLSLKEFQKVYDLLGSKFDSWNGEAFYADKMQEVVEKLEKTGKLVESEGAKIINLEDKGINTPCIIGKTNGSTTYATRDLAAILYRARTYNFEKVIYVTSYEQALHFKQIFEVSKLLGLEEKYTNNLIHVPFGMVQLKTGKMSTREGNIIKLETLLNESIQRAEEIIEEKNPNLEEKKEAAKKVGIGAIIFNDLSNSRIKDEIFDWETALNFQGETGPYIQYMYVRIKSILDKIEKIPEVKEVQIEELENGQAIKLIKLIYNFENIIKQAASKNEPSIIARYLIDLAQSYSTFYNDNKVINDNIRIQNARVYLTYATGNVLKIGAKLLGMQMPNKM